MSTTTAKDVSPFYTSKDFELVPDLLGLARPESEAFLKFNELIDRTDGAIPRRYRELIAIAVALTTQCPYCIEVHTKKAKALGVTPEEIGEAAFIAAALKAGAALAHSLIALKSYGRDGK